MNNNNTSDNNNNNNNNNNDNNNNNNNNEHQIIFETSRKSIEYIFEGENIKEKLYEIWDIYKNENGL